MPLPFWIGLTIFSSVCILAILKGGFEERLTGAFLVIANTTAPLLKDHRWLGPQWGLLTTDVLFLVLILWIAMHTQRWWPLFAAAFQVLNIFTHTASAVDTTLGAWTYVTAAVIWSYAILISLLVGALTAWRDRNSLRRLDRP